VRYPPRRQRAQRWAKPRPYPPVRLVEAEDGAAILWAERYDREPHGRVRRCRTKLRFSVGGCHRAQPATSRDQAAFRAQAGRIISTPTIFFAPRRWPMRYIPACRRAPPKGLPNPRASARHRSRPTRLAHGFAGLGRTKSSTWRRRHASQRTHDGAIRHAHCGARAPAAATRWRSALGGFAHRHGWRMNRKVAVEGVRDGIGPERILCLRVFIRMRASGIRRRRGACDRLGRARDSALSPLDAMKLHPPGYHWVRQFPARPIRRRAVVAGPAGRSN